MTEEQFQKIIDAIVQQAKPLPHIMTGLPAIDERNDQLRFTRALEILEKIVALEDSAKEQEKRAVVWIDSFGFSREDLRTELQKHWAQKQVGRQP